jgi:hypothetical protein
MPPLREDLVPEAESQLHQEHDHAMPFTSLSDDELMAQLLINTWTLTTGKTLRRDVPPQELAEEELIDFWSEESG